MLVWSVVFFHFRPDRQTDRQTDTLTPPKTVPTSLRIAGAQIMLLRRPRNVRQVEFSLSTGNTSF